jgi:Domain of unknown function (DUF6438)
MPPRTTVTLAFALLCATASGASAQTHYSHGKLAKAPSEVPVFTLERTQCKGQCAEYKLSFFADGTVTYDGKANVSKAGHWHAMIPRETVSRIVADFQRLNYFSLENSYAGGLDKNPVAITSLRQNDRVKTVSHDEGSPFSPEALTTLEDRIDGAVQSVDWVR